MDMVSFFDVPPNDLIKEVTQELKKSENMAPPEWSRFVKTGAHKERPPEQDDWWHIRAAALLLTIAKHGPVGIERLRTKYGGRKNRGHKPEHLKKASGNIIRTILQQLEKDNLILKKPKGRVIAPAGQKLLDAAAFKISKIVGVSV